MNTIVPTKQNALSSTVVDYQSITSLSSIPSALETRTLFSSQPAPRSLSPIDEFIENTNELNKFAPSGTAITREFGTLLLLGYMSAIESFMRALIRELVNLDEVCRRCSESKLISFGAAAHHKPALLPEALLEDVSFAGKDRVIDAFKAFLGIKNLAKDMGSLLDEYQKICELRHCCVHRFGKLGVKNAISLGLENHKECLEAPLILDTSSFAEMALRLRTFAKSINNVVCTRVFDRTVTNKDDHGNPLYTESWTWNFPKDRKRFRKYYEIFASSKDAILSPPLLDVYESFRRRHRSSK